MDHKREFKQRRRRRQRKSKKQQHWISETTTLHVQHTFLYFFITVNTTQENDFLFLFLNFDTVFQNSTPEKSVNICQITNGQIKLNGTNEITFEVARIHLLSDVFLTVVIFLFFHFLKPIRLGQRSINPPRLSHARLTIEQKSNNRGSVNRMLAGRQINAFNPDSDQCKYLRESKQPRANYFEKVSFNWYYTATYSDTQID